MNLTKVFIIPFHVTRTEQSIMPPDISGAYVSCYSVGQNYIEATEKSLKKLSQDGLHPQEILQPIHEMISEDWTKHISEMWPDHVASLLTQSEFEDAMVNARIVYGPFGSYA